MKPTRTEFPSRLRIVEEREPADGDYEVYLERRRRKLNPLPPPYKRPRDVILLQQETRTKHPLGISLDRILDHPIRIRHPLLAMVGTLGVAVTVFLLVTGLIALTQTTHTNHQTGVTIRSWSRYS